MIALCSSTGLQKEVTASGQAHTVSVRRREFRQELWRQPADAQSQQDVGGDERNDASLRKAEGERRVLGGKRRFPASPDEENKGGGGPKRRSRMKNWSEKLIRRDCN